MGKNSMLKEEMDKYYLETKKKFANKMLLVDKRLNKKIFIRQIQEVISDVDNILVKLKVIDYKEINSLVNVDPNYLKVLLNEGIANINKSLLIKKYKCYEVSEHLSEELNKLIITYQKLQLGKNEEVFENTINITLLYQELTKILIIERYVDEFKYNTYDYINKTVVMVIAICLAFTVVTKVSSYAKVQIGKVKVEIEQKKIAEEEAKRKKIEEEKKKQNEISNMKAIISNLNSTNVLEILDGTYKISELNNIVTYINSNDKIKNQLLEQTEIGYNQTRKINEIINITAENKLLINRIPLEIKIQDIAKEKLTNLKLFINDEEYESFENVTLVPGEYEFKLMDTTLGITTEIVRSEINKPISLSLNFNELELNNVSQLTIRSSLNGSTVYINGKKTEIIIENEIAVIPQIILGNSKVQLEYEMPWGKEFSEVYVPNKNILETRYTLSLENAAVAELMVRLENYYKNIEKPIDLTVYLESTTLSKEDNGQITIFITTAFNYWRGHGTWIDKNINKITYLDGKIQSIERLEENISRPYDINKTYYVKYQ